MAPLTWPQIATSDSFRQATPAQQGVIRMNWIKETMPQLYPASQNPLVYASVVRNVFQFHLPSKTADEDFILTPDTLNAANFTTVERNPLYTKKSYSEQQVLKNIWYAKTSVVDKSLNELLPENQRAFYTNLMRRGPALTTGIIPGYTPEEARRSFDASSRAGQAARTIVTNLVTSFGESLTDIVTGPLRLTMGPDSIVARAVDDVEKHREWINAISESSDFFTKTLPGLIGYGAGFAVGPWGGAQKLLSGGIKVARGITDAARIAEMAPGLVERVGTALGGKLPPLVYKATAGSLAGAGQGITDALSKGQPWHTGLAGNVALGFGAEFALRWVHQFSTIRRAAKELGMDPRHASEIFREPMQAGQDRVLSREHDALIKSNPDYHGVLDEMYAADPRGILNRNMYTPNGVKMFANVLKMDSEDANGVLSIRRGGQVVQQFNHGDVNVRVSKALDWLDSQAADRTDVWMSTQHKKQFSEVVQTAPSSLSVRKVTFIPDKARSHIADFFNDHGVHGFDYRLNPNHDSLEQIDDILGVVQHYKNPLAIEKAFTARGINFDPNPKVNRATIKQLKYEVSQLLPQGSYLVLDKVDPMKSRLALPTNGWMPSTGPGPRYGVDINVPHDDIPRVTLEAADKYEPAMTDKVFIGDPAQIRNHLELVARKTKQLDTQVKKQARGMANTRTTGTSYRKFNDSQVVEITIPMRDVQGNEAFVTLHSPSEKDAIGLLSSGVLDSKEKFAGHFFAKDPALKEQYDAYRKRMVRSKGKEWVDKNWMPFEYAAAQARQNDFYLGMYSGKYLLQDLRVQDTSYRQFDSLKEVIDHLNSHESRIGRPDFAGGISTEAIQEMYPNIAEPLSDLQARQLPKKKFGYYMALQSKISPTGWMLDRFANLEAVQESGVSPAKISNELSDMTSMVTDAQTQLTRRIAHDFEGLKKGEHEYLVRWQEGLDSPVGNVVTGGPLDSVAYEMRSDVEKEIGEKFGPERLTAIQSIGTRAERFYKDLFGWGKMDGVTMVKRYFPHLRAEAAKMGGAGTSYQWNKVLKNIPAQDRKFFMEFTRDMDPSDLHYSEYAKDPIEIAKLYSRLMIRKMYTRPIAKMIGNQLNEVNAAYRAAGKVPRDYVQFANYVHDAMESLGGVTGPTERTFETANTNVTEELSRRFNGLFGTKVEGTLKGKIGMINRLRTLSVGGQLAFRPYPVGRDLMSAFTSGAPVLGINNWLWGLDRMLKPGAMERFMNLGGTAPGSIPIAGEMDIASKGYGGFVRKGMQTYKWSVDFFRGITYMAAEHKALTALEQLNAGKISARKFVQESGANLWGRAEEAQMLEYLNKGQNPKLFVHELSKLATGRVHAMYETFNQPSMFRSAVGRLLGQYTTYPINYANLLITRMGSDSMTFGQKAKFIAELGAVTSSVVYGAQSVGINPRHFIPWDVVSFQGGPYYQLLDNMIRFINGDSQALKSVARDLSSMVPLALEGGGISQAYQALVDGEPWEAFVHLMDAPTVKGDFPVRKTPTDAIATAIQTAGHRYLVARGFAKS